MCLFKQLTGLPCPGCGCTRAFMSLLHGNVRQALWYNPVAVLLTILAAIFILLTIRDIVIHKRILALDEYVVFKLLHQKLPNWIFIVAGILTIANWSWNIIKEI